MKFSLMIELQISNPTRQKEIARILSVIEQAKLADTLGFHALWAVEHHGMLEYSHSSAPEVLLGHLSACTKNIRLGHGVCLTPYRYNHPIRVAERIATLDILSGGRINLGMGKSASLTEMMAFENDLDSMQDQWLEALDMIPRMWKDEIFEYKGEFFNVPPTRIIPKPVQSPHPPLVAACNNPEASEWVGKMGLGALNLAVGGDEYLKDLINRYRTAVAMADPEAYRPTNHFACAPLTCCLPDDKEACAYGFRGANFFKGVMDAYYMQRTRPLGPLDLPREFLPENELQEVMAQRTGNPEKPINLIGDPVHVRENVARFEEAGVDELLMLIQLGTVPDDIVLRSIQTIGEQVLPHFPKRSGSA